MSREHLIMLGVVIVGVIAAMWISTKLKINSFDEFESAS